MVSTTNIKSKGLKRKKNKETAGTASQKKQKRNQLIRERIIISSVELKGIKRNIALTITLDVLKNVYFLIWFVLKLI